MFRLAMPLSVICLALLGSNPARAGFTPVTFSGSQTDSTGYTRSADAIFTVVTVNSQMYLQIVLENTADHATNPVVQNNQVLTGVVFDVNPGATRPASGEVAALTAYAQAQQNTTSTNIGNEWLFRYAAGGLNSTFAQGYGFSTVGRDGTWGASDVVDPNAPNLDNKSDFGGTSFGMVEAGFVDGQGNGGMDSRVYVLSSATFTLQTVYDPLEITNVRFLYGTSLSDASFTGTEVNPVPAPQGFVLLLSGAPFLLAGRRLRRTLAASAKA